MSSSAEDVLVAGNGSGRSDESGRISVDSALYEECLANGCTPVLAEMLASRSFPGCRGTDRAFMQGRKLDGSQFEGLHPLVGRTYLEAAARAGVSVTGKYYSGVAARFPGDPEAWIDSTHDLKVLCERRGWGCTGAVEVKPREAGSDPLAGPYQVADDLVEDHVAAVLAQRPELAPRASEIREEVQGRLSGVHG